MTRIATLALLALVLSGCAAKTAYRDSCANQLDAAWRELDLAKACLLYTSDAADE